MDMFKDVFGDSDEEEEDFSGFELEDIEGQYNNEDDVAVGIVDERDDEEIRRVVGAEDLQWSREASHINLPLAYWHFLSKKDSWPTANSTSVCQRGTSIC